MATRIPGFIATAVVFLDDGMSISKLCKDPELDPDAIAAYLSSVVNSHIKAARVLSIAGSQDTNDILITSGGRYFVIRFLSEQQVFFYVVTEENGRLGTIRGLLKKYEKHVEKTLELQTG